MSEQAAMALCFTLAYIVVLVFVAASLIQSHTANDRRNKGSAPCLTSPHK